MPLRMVHPCCDCCIDGDRRPNGNITAAGWTGADFANIDEWPGDDDATHMRVTLAGGSSTEAIFTVESGIANNGQAVNSYMRAKVALLSGPGTLGNHGLSVRYFSGASFQSGVQHIWTFATNNAWVTIVGPSTFFNFTLPLECRVQATAGNPSDTLEFRISATRIAQLCP